MSFQVYGAAHLNYIYSMTFLWIVVPLIARKYLGLNSQRNLAIFLVVAIIGVEIIDDLYRVLEIKIMKTIDLSTRQLSLVTMQLIYLY